MNIDKKSRMAHAGFYLTLVSIMQSLVLGYLLQVISNELLNTGAIAANTVLQALTVLVMLIMVWHQYAMGTIIYSWELDLFDSGIPFLVGLTEYFVVAAMNMPPEKLQLGKVRYAFWLWALTAFIGVGLLAYWNQMRKARKRGALAYEGQLPRRNLKRSSVHLGVFVAIATLAWIHPVSPTYQWLVSLVVLSMFSVELWRIECDYAKVRAAGRRHRSVA